MLMDLCKKKRAGWGGEDQEAEVNKEDSWE